MYSNLGVLFVMCYTFKLKVNMLEMWQYFLSLFYLL